MNNLAILPQEYMYTNNFTIVLETPLSPIYVLCSVIEIHSSEYINVHWHDIGMKA